MECALLGAMGESFGNPELSGERPGLRAGWEEGKEVQDSQILDSLRIYLESCSISLAIFGPLATSK